MGNMFKVQSYQKINGTKNSTGITEENSINIKWKKISEIDESDCKNFMIRYTKDENGNIIKQQSTGSVFKLIGAYKCSDLNKLFLGNIGHIVKNNNIETNTNEFIFSVNFLTQVINNQYDSYIIYFKCDKSNILSDERFTNFFTDETMPNEDRNNILKLIPNIVDGNMIVKMAVKNTPCLIGNKIKTTYVLKQNYFEVCMDTSTSSSSRHIVQLVAGYSKNIVVDIGFCLQTELPEKMLCVCRFNKYDCTKE